MAPGTVNIFGMLAHEPLATGIPALWGPALPKPKKIEKKPPPSGPCPSGSPFKLNVKVPPCSKEEVAVKIFNCEFRRWCRAKGRRHGGHGAPDSLQEMFKEWFALVDQDGSGTVSVAEVRLAATKSHLPQELGLIQELVAHLDYDGNGEVDFDEFCGFLEEEMAAGRDVFRTEFVLPSGRSLALGPVLGLLRRRKMMSEVFQSGDARKDAVNRGVALIDTIITQREVKAKEHLEEQARQLKELQRKNAQRMVEAHLQQALQAESKMSTPRGEAQTAAHRLSSQGTPRSSIISQLSIHETTPRNRRRSSSAGTGPALSRMSCDGAFMRTSEPGRATRTSDPGRGRVSDPGKGKEPNPFGTTADPGVLPVLQEEEEELGEEEENNRPFGLTRQKSMFEKEIEEAMRNLPAQGVDEQVQPWQEHMSWWKQKDGPVPSSAPRVFTYKADESVEGPPPHELMLNQVGQLLLAHNLRKISKKYPIPPSLIIPSSSPLELETNSKLSSPGLHLPLHKVTDSSPTQTDTLADLGLLQQGSPAYKPQGQADPHFTLWRSSGMSPGSSSRPMTAKPYRSVPSERNTSNGRPQTAPNARGSAHGAKPLSPGSPPQMIVPRLRMQHLVATTPRPLTPTGAATLSLQLAGKDSARECLASPRPNSAAIRPSTAPSSGIFRPSTTQSPVPHHLSRSPSLTSTSPTMPSTSHPVLPTPSTTPASNQGPTKHQPMVYPAFSKQFMDDMAHHAQEALKSLIQQTRPGAQPETLTPGGVSALTAPVGVMRKGHQGSPSAAFLIASGRREKHDEVLKVHNQQRPMTQAAATYDPSAVSPRHAALAALPANTANPSSDQDAQGAIHNASDNNQQVWCDGQESASPLGSPGSPRSPRSPRHLEMVTRSHPAGSRAWDGPTEASKFWSTVALQNDTCAYKEDLAPPTVTTSLPSPTTHNPYMLGGSTDTPAATPSAAVSPARPTYADGQRTSGPGAQTALLTPARASVPGALHLAVQPHDSPRSHQTGYTEKRQNSPYLLSRHTTTPPRQRPSSRPQTARTTSSRPLSPTTSPGGCKTPTRGDEAISNSTSSRKAVAELVMTRLAQKSKPYAWQLSQAALLHTPVVAPFSHTPSTLSHNAGGDEGRPVPRCTATGRAADEASQMHRTRSAGPSSPVHKGFRAVQAQRPSLTKPDSPRNYLDAFGLDRKAQEQRDALSPPHLRLQHMECSVLHARDTWKR